MTGSDEQMIERADLFALNLKSIAKRERNIGNAELSRVIDEAALMIEALRASPVDPTVAGLREALEAARVEACISASNGVDFNRTARMKRLREKIDQALAASLPLQGDDGRLREAAQRLVSAWVEGCPFKEMEEVGYFAELDAALNEGKPREGEG